MDMWLRNPQPLHQFRSFPASPAVFPQDTDLVGHDFVELFLRAIGRSVFADAEPSGHIYRGPFYYEIQIGHIFAAPCHNVVPHALGHRDSFPCLVKEFSDHREVCHLAVVVLIEADRADMPLELDTVDVFDVFHQN